MFLVCGESASAEESQCLIYLTKTVLLGWIAKKGPDQNISHTTNAFP